MRTIHHENCPVLRDLFYPAAEQIGVRGLEAVIANASDPGFPTARYTH